MADWMIDYTCSSVWMFQVEQQVQPLSLSMLKAFSCARAITRSTGQESTPGETVSDSRCKFDRHCIWKYTSIVQCHSSSVIRACAPCAGMMSSTQWARVWVYLVLLCCMSSPLILSLFPVTLSSPVTNKAMKWGKRSSIHHVLWLLFNFYAHKQT